MTKTEFNKLPYSRRSDLIWEYGNFIYSDKISGINRVIFTLDDLVIEIFFKHGDASKNSILAIDVKSIFPHLQRVITKPNPFLMYVCAKAGIHLNELNSVPC
jgi:hypothetical protein